MGDLPKRDHLGRILVRVRQSDGIYQVGYFDACAGLPSDFKVLGRANSPKAALATLKVIVELDPKIYAEE